MSASWLHRAQLNDREAWIKEKKKKIGSES